MKFNFKIQKYQTEAVESVIDVFRGQGYQERVGYIRDIGTLSRQNTQISFEMMNGSNLMLDSSPEIGFRNEEIDLSDDQLLSNIHRIQNRKNIKVSPSLIKDLGRCSLDIEMETGTGKTYVYTKTIFELNKKYGWTKFIIVVPSIAIREGVKKSLEMTQEHFMEQYGKKARFFIYNSSELYKIDRFSSSSEINIMIINTQAFSASLNEEKNVDGRKGDFAARIIYSKRDEFGSRRPIDVISANRPILILDEPQKMGREGSTTQKALEKFNPLFSLNYSATHTKHHNLVYVLDALDAYNKKLVKKIEVKGFELKNFKGTEKYLYLENIVLSPKKPPMARIEFEVLRNKAICRETHVIGVGDNLYYASNEMEQYKDYTISEIDPIGGKVTFSNGEVIKRGDISEKDMRRIQIRETIASHFEKEEKLFNMGIKTLSLFFIDKVEKYRVYDEFGNEGLGEYGKIFEEEYNNALSEYMTFEDTPYQKYLKEISTSSTHKGYFSIDKKTGRSIDSILKRGSLFSDDISAYELILKNKERLLSFEEPTRFIFSHSALREGWDNPNIFQICTLKHSDSQTTKRQEVGRGLRLSVNKDGTRIDEESCPDMVHSINKLTVIASESYKDFVSGLQSDIKEVLYDRPSKANIEYFEGKNISINDRTLTLDDRQARNIYRYLIKNDYIDEDDNVTEKYREDLENNSLAKMPDDIIEIAEEVHNLIQAIYSEAVFSNMFEDANITKIYENQLNDNFFKEEFQTLWNMINHKYAYTVSFNSEELVEKSIDAINEKLFVSELQYTVSKGEQKSILKGDEIEDGTSFDLYKTNTRTLKHSSVGDIKYDVIGKIAEGATLTRKTAAKILQGISFEKMYMFKNNPEDFIIKVIRLIKEQKAILIVDNISYREIEGKYSEKIFTSEKHSQSIDKVYHATKHIQDYVFIDGSSNQSVERRFAQALDTASEVCAYAKLPKKFSIPTPMGNYSPDWAIAFYAGTVKHIFFIAETKGTMESLELRPIEQAKILCAKKLFNEISTNQVKYHDVDSYDTLLNVMNNL